MIEVSITEVLLFAWAVTATAYAFKFKELDHHHRFIIHKILNDEKVRNDLVESYAAAQKGTSA